jgi:hypothetical protein
MPIGAFKRLPSVNGYSNNAGCAAWPNYHNAPQFLPGLTNTCAGAYLSGYPDRQEICHYDKSLPFLLRAPPAPTGIISGPFFGIEKNAAKNGSEILSGQIPRYPPARTDSDLLDDYQQY